MNSRSYTMSKRAVDAEATGHRIVQAAWRAFGTLPYDEVILDAVAAEAGVTTQTVLRRFGSKEGLVRAVTDEISAEIIAQRDLAPVGDISGAVANLLEHYEAVGDQVLHVLRQEKRVAGFAEAMDRGRDLHAEWVERVFAPWLHRREGADRKRLRAQLIAVCDVYVWFLLRRQASLSRRATGTAMNELLMGVLK